jgi:hypothetical protein
MHQILGHYFRSISYYHLLACQQILTESHIVTRLAIERASFMNMNDINEI